MGVNALQTKLQDEWKCTIAIDTVWKRKENVMIELYGNCEASFGLLFN
jgi:hypothetical protein